MQELLHSYAISKETISDLIFHPMKVSTQSLDFSGLIVSNEEDKFESDEHVLRVISLKLLSEKIWRTLFDVSEAVFFLSRCSIKNKHLASKSTRHIRFLILNQLTTENREEKISQLLRLLLPQIGIPLKNRIPQDKCYPTTVVHCCSGETTVN